MHQAGRWLRFANAALYRAQRYACGLMLRHLWSAHARMGNRLRRSGYEAYRREFNLIVGKNRAGAPKPKAGPAARPRISHEEQQEGL